MALIRHTANAHNPTKQKHAVPVLHCSQLKRQMKKKSNYIIVPSTTTFSFISHAQMPVSVEIFAFQQMFAAGKRITRVRRKLAIFCIMK